MLLARVALALLSLAFVFPAHAADPEEAAVLAAAQSLFDSWREADAAKGDRVLHPAFRLTTWRAAYDGDDPARKGEAPHVGSSDRAAMMAIYRSAKPGSWDDRVKNVRVHVDAGRMASVWADYGFFISGALSHCGAVSLQLYRTKAGWQIVSFADTHQWAKDKPACAKAWG